MLIDDLAPSLGNTGFLLLPAFLSCLAPPTSPFFSALFSGLPDLQAHVSQAHPFQAQPLWPLATGRSSLTEQLVVYYPSGQGGALLHVLS